MLLEVVDELLDMVAVVAVEFLTDPRCNLGLPEELREQSHRRVVPVTPVTESRPVRLLRIDTHRY